MSKFATWTDEELEELVEAFECCASEGQGCANPDIPKALENALEERGLEEPWWKGLFR